MKNADNAGYFRFTGPARLDKAVHTLGGLLRGISADGHVSEAECAAIMRWIAEHREFEQKHPFCELIPMLDRALLDGTLEQEEVADILWLCDRLTSDSEYYDLLTSDMQRLQGMLGGIISDGVVTVEELEALGAWMADHEHLRRCWPYDEIDSLLMAVRADKKIDEQEHRMLTSFFSEFCHTQGNRAVDLPLNEVNTPVTGFCAACPQVLFKDNTFCFTGSSQKATRKDLAKLVENLGGMFIPRITREVNYLIIGAEGNPCWAFSCYGRKVEAAISLRKQGAKILLVHEYDFWDAVESERSQQ